MIPCMYVKINFDFLLSVSAFLFIGYCSINICVYFVCA